MIELTAEKIQNAISKARAVKPRVRVNRFGSYTVTNKATGASYTVTCERRAGLRLAHCTCKAGERGRAGVLSRRGGGRRAHSACRRTRNAQLLNRRA